ncbi:hypothetical protein HMPREF9629_01225 [Peptoanaerobacter stomatis]|uniref:Uncharacterized protein n=1 Tax=Peptoanaerobacter stomatis TaxID=796937 RepID=G9WYH4_9FIRM|nr:hypothetical protein [Peptoanaerobacter stomatis]EHL16385.1 hypothetical protein HMPREF9629_01225 [Peptoanaerobacter stomatis]
MKKVIVLVMCIIAVILSIYTLSRKDIKLGMYAYGTLEDGSYSYVLLKENNEFEFVRNIATSYVPIGKYKVDGNILILNGINDLYKFQIDGDKLIFLSSNKDTALIDKGTVFVLEKN